MFVWPGSPRAIARKLSTNPGALVAVTGRHPSDLAWLGARMEDLHAWHMERPIAVAVGFLVLFAGVYLFLSGLISGYYDNQALYHRIPQRLRRVKWLRRLIGPARLAHCMRWIAQAETALDMMVDRSLNRYAHGSPDALNARELEGFNVYRSFVARCSECHTPPLFTNQQVAVIGVPEPDGRPFDPGAAVPSDWKAIQCTRADTPARRARLYR